MTNDERTLKLRSLGLSDSHQRRVIRAFGDIIGKFCFKDGITSVPRKQIQEYFNILTEGLLLMKGDLKWSLARSLDNLSGFLRCKLDNKDWSPSTRSSWGVQEENEPTILHRSENETLIVGPDGKPFRLEIT